MDHPHPPPLVAVTGASGHLGATVVRALVARGDRVRALILDGDDALEADPVRIERSGEGAAIPILRAPEQDLRSGDEDRLGRAPRHSVTAETRPLGSIESSVSVGPGTTGLPLTTSVRVFGRSRRIR